MGAFFDFILGIFQFLLFLILIIGGVAFWGYNTLRALSENIRESWSNIGVVGKKQVSLINQLIDVVKGYQESEKLVMLKVSEDVSSTNQLAQMHMQSNMVLSTIGNMAQKFPELKANNQYQRLIDSIQACEAQLENARQQYNRSVKTYNTTRSSIPHVFYAVTLGFKNAPYLEFSDDTPVLEVGEMKPFMTDQDGEMINKLLGQAGNKLLEASNKALDGGKQIAEVAHEKLRKIQNTNSGDASKNSQTDIGVSDKNIKCVSCQIVLAPNSAFCSNCGAKVN